MSAALCPICLGDLKETDERVELDCRHVYHKACMDACLIGKEDSPFTCPCCSSTTELAATVSDDNGAEMQDLDSLVLAEDASPSERMIMPHPKFESPSVFCSTCGNQVTLMKCRLLSKRAGTWRCDVCQCRIVQLHRGVGEWPPKQWANISPEDQKEFMASLHDRRGPACVVAAKEFLKKYEQHETYYEFSGEYLPLSVWKVRGFDSDLIESKSSQEDCQTHPILGVVYRVKTLKSGSRGAEGMERSSILQAKGKRPRTVNAVTAEEALPLTERVADDVPELKTIQDEGEDEQDTQSDKKDSSSSDSDSSSDSSSDDRKKSKNNKKSEKSKKGHKDNKSKKDRKHKKSKKEKKSSGNKRSKQDEQREKDEKAKALIDAKAKKANDLMAKKEAAAQAAKDKQTTTLAQQILNKVTTPMYSMTATLAQPLSLKLPDFVVDAGKMHLSSLQKIVKEAQLAQASPAGFVFNLTLKEIGKAASDSRKHEILMTQMLATVQKLAAEK